MNEAVNDIRPLKNKIREKCKKIRTEMPELQKRGLDRKITARLLNLWQYRDADTVFTYVSTDLEVDTREFISRALLDGKTVAVPKCVDGTRLMDFYVIKSFDDLESGAFGVLEPIPEKCEKITDFSAGMCIVPALAFDRAGYRLGYGKGYYDRFLSNYCGETLGLCYNSCIRDKLPHGKYDRCVDKIITQSNIIFTNGMKGG